MPEPEGLTVVFGRSYYQHDVEISDPSSDGTNRTRKILRPDRHPNMKNPRATVSISLRHQRRASGKAPWSDPDAFNAATLKAGQEICMNLSSSETLRVYEFLHAHYRSQDTSQVDDELIAALQEGAPISERVKHVMRRLLRVRDERIWDVIDELRPGFVEAAALRRQHAHRTEALKEFREHLAAEDWSEGEWESYFRSNAWIFGQGLTYRFLDEFEGQAYLGGMVVGGKGGQRVDFMMASEAEAKFTVLIDIKLPESRLLHPMEYRNHAYRIDHALAGGVAQLQSYCLTWEVDGARDLRNHTMLQSLGINTVHPKGILIIGNLRQLSGHDPLTDLNRRTSFESFRRSVSNPEIITYDELLARADYIVSSMLPRDYVPADL